MAATVKAAAKKRAVAKRKPAAARKKSAARKPHVATKHKAPMAPARAAARKVPEQSLMKALRAEHRHMRTVMQLFSEQLLAIEGGELVDTHVVYEIMHYMVTWPDRFHHPREDLIYSRVAEVDPHSADDVDTLQRDHDQTAKRGRAVLRDIERWRLGEVDGTVVIKSGRDYIDNIYQHMTIEEKRVFPHIEATLSLQDWRELAADDEIRAVGDSVFGPRVQREFRNLTRKLRRGLRRSVERGTLVEWIGVEAFMESLEVVSIAYESARDTTGDSLRGAWRDAQGFFREAPLSAPLRCVANNTRVTLRLLGEVVAISRETLDDLSRVNQERRNRVRLLDRNSSGHAARKSPRQSVQH
jgi:hemerythrin-like domain-containing protein